MSKTKNTKEKVKELKPAGLITIEEVSFALNAGFDLVFEMLNEAANCPCCHEKK